MAVLPKNGGREVSTQCAQQFGYYVSADDTQLYISFKCKQPLEAILKVNNCFSDIRRWMITNKLNINDSKTEFIVLHN